MKNSMENMHTDVRVLKSLYYHFLFLFNTVGIPSTNDDDVRPQESSSLEV